MKFGIVISFVVCAFVAGASAGKLIPVPPNTKCIAPNPEQGLQPLAAKLIDLVPEEKVIEILKKYQNDTQIKNVLRYVNSKDFKRTFLGLQRRHEFKAIIDFECKQMYFDAQFYLDKINAALHLPVQRMTLHHLGMLELTAGVHGLAEEIKKVLPLEEIKALYAEVRANDPYVQEAEKQIGSEEFRELSAKLMEVPEFRKIVKDMQALVGKTHREE